MKEREPSVDMLCGAVYATAETKCSPLRETSAKEKQRVAAVQRKNVRPLWQKWGVRHVETK